MKLPKFTIMRIFMFVIMLPTSMVLLTIATMHHDTQEFKVTHEVFLDIESEGKPMGRIVLGLFGEAAPKTVANFLTLATKGQQGKRYKGTRFHRVIKRFMIQGGDVVSGDGQGSISIYGYTFPDETFEIKHSRPGFLSMANKGKDTNGCQFFLTTIATPWLDGHHVAFGKIIGGLSVLYKIESSATDWNDRPFKDIIIAEGGRQPLAEPYYISDDPYNLRDWLKTISVPLGLSFAIMSIFNYYMKKLDACIIEDDGSFDDEETALRKKKLRELEAKKMEEEEEKKKLTEDKKVEREGEAEVNVRKRVVKGDKE